MHPFEFARKRARIERRAGSRAAFFRKAMARLVQEARAVTIIVRGQVVGWRMAAGGVVCVKHRYRDEITAMLELARIQQHADRPHHIPIRHYRCHRCGGFHLTSQQQFAANDNEGE